MSLFPVRHLPMGITHICIYRWIPYRANPYRGILCRGISSRGIPHRQLPYRQIPHRGIPYSRSYLEWNALRPRGATARTARPATEGGWGGGWGWGKNNIIICPPTIPNPEGIPIGFNIPWRTQQILKGILQDLTNPEGNPIGFNKSCRGSCRI